MVSWLGKVKKSTPKKVRQEIFLKKIFGFRVSCNCNHNCKPLKKILSFFKSHMVEKHSNCNVKHKLRRSTMWFWMFCKPSTAAKPQNLGIRYWAESSKLSELFIDDISCYQQKGTLSQSITNICKNIASADMCFFY